MQHLLFLFVTTVNSLFLGGVQPSDFPSANISTKWINSPSLQDRIIGPTFRNSSDIQDRIILSRGKSGPAFACGFQCTSSCNFFVFSIFIAFANSNGSILDFPYFPQIIWSANRDHFVHENATVEFSKTGDLLLHDSDGTQVWSTNTSGKSVVGMHLNEVGNLVLFDDKNTTVWSSMDHPTDTLVLGQTLRQGQRLTANTSAYNTTQGSFFLSVVRGGFQAFVGSNPPQMYYQNTVPLYGDKNLTYLSFNNGSLDVFAGSDVSSTPRLSIPLPLANSTQYMQLDYSGHLRLYEYNAEVLHLGDVFIIDRQNGFNIAEDCAYPTFCGEYGICSDGQCSCPAADDDSLSYFKPVDQRNPRLGCSPSPAISCKSNETRLLFLQNVSYFNYIDSDAAYMHNTNAETCKKACLMNCSCKAAFFKYGHNSSRGSCYVPSELFTLTNDPQYPDYNSSAFIKVQSFPISNSTSGSKKVGAGVIVGASVGSLVSFFLLVVCMFAFVRRRNRYKEVEEEDEFNMLPGLPTRFTFEKLKIATNDFLLKLGEGGFGSVFEGTLLDGTKIAVKRLEGIGQGKKEFLAEVETIGSIHHIHLVRLVGFCAEKSYRLLVYEYMPNGSLDNWIFYKKHDDIVLDWQTRRKIIAHIAKGLAYLHEECRQKIVHLDIKPQNILLDVNFHAKVSDFGLAKLIDRDQVQVITRMRGTPGYLAPEWLTSVITEKVDVFSFGIVVLEIICGRRNLDYSNDEEGVHLISLLQQKVEAKRMADIVDCRSAEMKGLHIDDVTAIMHLAMWCLQSDSKRRPSMALVLKVLEGSMDVEANLDYNFSNPAPYASRNAHVVESFLPTASILSGPR